MATAPAPCLTHFRRLSGRLQWPNNAWHRHTARRWVAAKNRWNLIRQRANEQHIDYVRQLKGPRPQRSLEVDPRLQSHRQDFRQTIAYPELTQQPSEELQLLGPEDALEQRFQGEIRSVPFEPFGTIDIVHGDIFDVEAEAAIFPMAPNLMPYRGLGLEAFDRGGRELVQETFIKAKEDCEERDSKEGLKAGDTLVVGGRGVRTKNIMFVIMPWFWQGSPMDAAKRFRFCAKSAFGRAAADNGFSSIALPNVGGGIFGYEPRDCSLILLEEAVESLLQIEARVPSYRLKKITFIEADLETAESLHGALVEVAHRWLPEKQVTTAPQYWGHSSRRLVVMPDAPCWFWRRHRVKFKKHHGVKRRQRYNWRSNIKPFLWRAHKVHQPPPLMVYRQTGEPAPHDRQLPARPFYFRGVTHWLFPNRRSGFHMLRKSGRGTWVAKAAKMAHYRPGVDARPRL